MMVDVLGLTTLEHTVWIASCRVIESGSKITTILTGQSDPPVQLYTYEQAFGQPEATLPDPHPLHGQLPACMTNSSNLK
jgi:hypothetical protein